MSDIQTWTRTDKDGYSQSVTAVPSRRHGGDAVFEITEAALSILLTEAGFSREDGGA